MRTLTEQAEAVARGDVSPVELVERTLDAIERVERDLNAFTHVFPDAALDDAKRLEGRDPVGPLHGVPVAVKELYDVADAPTTGCCTAYADRRATSDSAVVERLREAGAIVVTKTNQHEIALGTTTQLSSFGPALNPWDPTRIPGGSSGGSGAAVAAGAVAMAMGSDTGGSIRIPASFCGVTGLKPTHGAVSLRGAMPLAPSLDTAGPLAVSAADCALVHGVLAGFDPDDPYSTEGRGSEAPASLSRLRVAVLRRWHTDVHPEVRTKLEETAGALEELGAVVDEVEGPDPEASRERFAPLLLAEAAHHYRDLLDGENVTPHTHRLLRFGAALQAIDYVAAREAQMRLRRDFEWALTSADVLLTPVVPFPAPPVDADEVEIADGVRVPAHAVGATRLTLPVNVAGLPALSFPVGFTSEGLPVAGQLIGPAWSEAFLCGVGAAYQQVTDHHLKEPAGASS